MTEDTDIVEQAPTVAPCLMGHLAVMRFDHWVKNVFVLPGIAVAWLMPGAEGAAAVSWDVAALALGMLAIGLVASSNYVINELLDAPHDRMHPIKRSRPVPAGLVSPRLAVVQWLVLAAVGIGMAWAVRPPLALVLGILWGMGCVYNIPPVRSKDVPYWDVLSEAVNNPLRMMAGWFMVRGDWNLPVALLAAYWFVGAFFMAIKRFAEFREIGDPAVAAAYRKSFAHYTERRLLTSIMFHGSLAMLFFGKFAGGFMPSLVFSFPFVAMVMAIYFDISFPAHSAAQAPEKLHREPRLMTAVILCTAVMVLLAVFARRWQG